MLVNLEYKNTPTFINDALPDSIAENDIYLFLDARKNSSKLITEVSQPGTFLSLSMINLLV